MENAQASFGGGIWRVKGALSFRPGGVGSFQRARASVAEQIVVGDFEIIPEDDLSRGYVARTGGSTPVESCRPLLRLPRSKFARVRRREEIVRK